MLSQLFEWNEPKKISDGQTISTDFKLPAITKTMMLVKNLKIILDPSITNDTVNNPNQLIYFGPLIMKQQLFVNKTNNQKFLKAVTNVRTIKSDQLNSLTKKTAPIESIKADFAEKPAAQPTVETSKANPVVFNHKMNMNVMGGIRNLRPVMPTPHVATPVRPQPTPIKPVTPVVTGPIKIPGIFVPIRVPVQTPTAANVQFKVFDKINNDPVYKCSISIKGTNNSRIFEIETNEIGMISQMVPVGEYSIELRVDDYAVLNQNFSVVNTNPLNLEYKLQREEVKFKSFFLIGMICERMPKIPVN